MASDTALAQNGIPNGEDASAPLTPSSEGRHLHLPDNPSPEHKETEEEHAVQGTEEPDTLAPEEQEEGKTAVEDEDPLLDYEYYENLELLEKSGADSAKPEDGQSDSVKGTPHDDERDVTKDAVDNNEPSSSLGSNVPSDEPHSDQMLPGPEPNDEEDPSAREVDEISEGTAPTPTTTAPWNTDEASGEVSDNKKCGAGERPVRRRLKKTSIAEGAQAADSMASSQDSLQEKSDQANERGDNEGRGRVRKRSLDDLEQNDTPEDGKTEDSDTTGHRRKRSRDASNQPDDGKSEEKSPEWPAGGAPPEDAGTEPEVPTASEHTPSEEKTEESSDKLRSPKKKRSRDQFDADLLKTTDDTEMPKEVAAECAAGEPEKKRHRDRSHERSLEKKDDVDSTKTDLPKPFSNTSTASPFSSLPPQPDTESTKDGTPKETVGTSNTAFASSSLSAFAGTEKSPFGAVGGTESVFKSSTAPSSGAKEGGSAPSAFAKSAFGAAAASTSAFGSIGGGFGGGSAGSAFGSTAIKPSGGLTSFAAPSGPSVLGSSSKTKVLGATPDDDNEGEEGDDERHDNEVDKQDERFYKQDLETGEEGEKTYFTCRSKLFHFDSGEWKERGVGTFKVNVSKAQAEEGQPEDGDETSAPSTKKSARMIMRTEGVLRVVLNTPIFKGMKVGGPAGEEPSDKQVNLAALEKGKTVPLLLRTGNPALAKDLYHTIQDLLPQL